MKGVTMSTLRDAEALNSAIMLIDKLKSGVDMYEQGNYVGWEILSRISQQLHQQAREFWIDQGPNPSTKLD
jgi:hypothetical protein